MTVALIEENPSFKKPAMRLLSEIKRLQEAGQPFDRTTVVPRVSADWSCTHTAPVTLLDIMVKKDIVREDLTIEGKPYHGTLEDAQLDFSVPDNADYTMEITILEQGEELLRSYAPDETLRNLLAKKGNYRDIFCAMVAACDTEAGCSREKLEAVINEFPALGKDPQTHQTKVYPQFFIDALESAGGITWTDAWRTTDAGRGMLEEA